MINRIIVGLGHRARSGKDTVATRLVAKHGFRRIAFADALKRACAAVFGLTEDQMNVEPAKSQPDPFWVDSPRRILQVVGMECFRVGYRQDVWVKAVERVVMAKPTWDRWVIPDVRFGNEVDAIRSWGGKVVKVERPNAPTVASHISEHALDGAVWDAVIVNNSTIDELNAKVDWLVKSLETT